MIAWSPEWLQEDACTAKPLLSRAAQDQAQIHAGLSSTAKSGSRLYSCSKVSQAIKRALLVHEPRWPSKRNGQAVLPSLKSRLAILIYIEPRTAAGGCLSCQASARGLWSWQDPYAAQPWSCIRSSPNPCRAEQHRRQTLSSLDLHSEAAAWGHKPLLVDERPQRSSKRQGCAANPHKWTGNDLHRVQNSCREVLVLPSLSTRAVKLVRYLCSQSLDLELHMVE